MKEYKMREDMAQNRSVWHMKTNAVPLHGGGLLGEKMRKSVCIIISRHMLITHMSVKIVSD